MGDKLYGRQARLLERVEGVGWLPVVRVASSLYQPVRAQSRLRALARLAEYGWALRERYRIEPVFGSVKSAYGSYIGCRRGAYGMVRVWGQLVLWNMVQYLRVRGGGVFLLRVGCGGCVVWGWEGNFRTPSFSPLTSPIKAWYNRNAGDNQEWKRAERGCNHPQPFPLLKTRLTLSDGGQMR